MKLLRFLVPLALVALCLVLAEGQGVLDRLAGVHPGWIAASVLILTAVIALSALRWRLTADSLGLPMTGVDALREYYLAQFVNQTLPGGVLGDASRAVRSRQGGPVTPAAQSVVLERASGQVGMALVLGVGVLGAMVHPRAPIRLDVAFWLPAAVLVGMAAVLAALAMTRVSGSWGAAVRTALVARWPVQVALSLAIAALTVAAFATSARATGTPLEPLAAALIVPPVLTAMLLPASVAGWGWREGAAAALFPLAGLAPEAGIAASIAFGVAVLASTLPGAFFVLYPPPRKLPPVACARE
ncbi:UPF0104 family protein [Rhodobacterales bacterium HKCCE2091]|nr:UPF0104 family protein [Rhodobacterales bacterium HKCCE2091]